MPLLPLKQVPLNQHSLAALESWLIDLGAERGENDPCTWFLIMQDWSVKISLEKDALSVIWNKDGKEKPCSFSYAFSRQDIEIAILQGP